MVEGIRILNLSVPVCVYRVLKARSGRTDTPIAEIVRQAIEAFLKNSRDKGKQEKYLEGNEG